MVTKKLLLQVDYTLYFYSNQYFFCRFVNVLPEEGPKSFSMTISHGSKSCFYITEITQDFFCLFHIKNNIKNP